MWTSQGEQIPGVGQGGYYANLMAPARSRMLVDLVFHVFFGNYFTVSGWMFKFKDVHWVEKYGVCVAANHPPSSFYMQRCHSQLQIKQSYFRENYGLTLYSISGGWNSDLINLCCLYCKISLSCCFALTVCMFFSRSNCENWIDDNETPPSNVPHYVVLCAHTQYVSVFSEETIA